MPYVEQSTGVSLDLRTRSPRRVKDYGTRTHSREKWTRQVSLSHRIDIGNESRSHDTLEKYRFDRPFTASAFGSCGKLV
jgi:hypothetical protein